MEKVTSSKFISAICDKAPLTKQVAADILKVFIDTIIDNVMEGKAVFFKRFGKFVVKTKKGRVGRNPRTGEIVNIEERKFLKFYPSKEFRNIKKHE